MIRIWFGLIRIWFGLIRIWFGYRIWFRFRLEDTVTVQLRRIGDELGLKQSLLFHLKESHKWS